MLEESLRRIEELLNLKTPAAFFDEMIASGVLESLPDIRKLMGAKKMLLDQSHVDDVLETSVHKRYSKRRTIAANIQYELGKQVIFQLQTYTEYLFSCQRVLCTHIRYLVGYFGSQWPHKRENTRGIYTKDANPVKHSTNSHFWFCCAMSMIVDASRPPDCLFGGCFLNSFSTYSVEHGLAMHLLSSSRKYRPDAIDLCEHAM